MAWIYLIVASGLEVVWASGLKKLADGRMARGAMIAAMKGYGS